MSSSAGQTDEGEGETSDATVDDETNVTRLIELFQELDLDQDGRLDTLEMAEARQRVNIVFANVHGFGGGRVLETFKDNQALLSHFDADGDGTLSLVEFTTGMTRMPVDWDTSEADNQRKWRHQQRQLQHEEEQQKVNMGREEAAIVTESEPAAIAIADEVEASKPQRAAAPLQESNLQRMACKAAARKDTDRLSKEAPTAAAATTAAAAAAANANASATTNLQMRPRVPFANSELAEASVNPQGSTVPHGHPCRATTGITLAQKSDQQQRHVLLTLAMAADVPVGSTPLPRFCVSVYEPGTGGVPLVQWLSDAQVDSLGLSTVGDTSTRDDNASACSTHQGVARALKRLFVHADDDQNGQLKLRVAEEEEEEEEADASTMVLMSDSPVKSLPVDQDRLPTHQYASHEGLFVSSASLTFTVYKEDAQFASAQLSLRNENASQPLAFSIEPVANLKPGRARSLGLVSAFASSTASSTTHMSYIPRPSKGVLLPGRSQVITISLDLTDELMRSAQDGEGLDFSQVQKERDGDTFLLRAVVPPAMLVYCKGEAIADRLEDRKNSVLSGAMALFADKLKAKKNKDISHRRLPVTILFAEGAPPAAVRDGIAAGSDEAAAALAEAKRQMEKVIERRQRHQRLMASRRKRLQGERGSGSRVQEEAEEGDVDGSPKDGQLVMDALVFEADAEAPGIEEQEEEEELLSSSWMLEHNEDPEDGLLATLGTENGQTETCQEQNDDQPPAPGPEPQNLMATSEPDAKPPLIETHARLKAADRAEILFSPKRKPKNAHVLDFKDPAKAEDAGPAAQHEARNWQGTTGPVIVEEKEEEDRQAAKTKVIESIVVLHVDLDKPMGIAIEHPDDEDKTADDRTYPVFVSNVVAGGQGEAAGVKVGMQIMQVNGVDREEIDSVLRVVLECKQEKRPLVMAFAMRGGYRDVDGVGCSSSDNDDDDEDDDGKDNDDDAAVQAAAQAADAQAVSAQAAAKREKEEEARHQNVNDLVQVFTEIDELSASRITVQQLGVALPRLNAVFAQIHRADTLKLAKAEAKVGDNEKGLPFPSITALLRHFEVGGPGWQAAVHNDGGGGGSSSDVSSPTVSMLQFISCMTKPIPPEEIQARIAAAAAVVNGSIDTKTGTPVGGRRSRLAVDTSSEGGAVGDASYSLLHPEDVEKSTSRATPRSPVADQEVKFFSSSSHVKFFK